MKDEKDQEDWVEWDDWKYSREDGIAFLVVLGIFVIIQILMGLFFWCTL